MLQCHVLLHGVGMHDSRECNALALARRAASIADRMMGAFDTPTGIPLGQINLRKSEAVATNWAGVSMSVLSELGSIQLEFVHLSTRTGNATYRMAAERIVEFLHDEYGDQVG